MTQLTTADVIAYVAKLNSGVAARGILMSNKRFQFLGTGPYVNENLAYLLPDGATVIDEQST